MTEPAPFRGFHVQRPEPPENKAKRALQNLAEGELTPEQCGRTLVYCGVLMGAPFEFDWDEPVIREIKGCKPDESC